MLTGIIQAVQKYKRANKYRQYNRERILAILDAAKAQVNLFVHQD